MILRVNGGSSGPLETWVACVLSYRCSSNHSLQSDEAPAAILIAHGAHLTLKKQSRRRAAYWYAVAASRLEKCGIVGHTSLSSAYALTNHLETSHRALSAESASSL